MRIQPSGGLSEDDIKRMVKEAEEHANEDKGRRELAEAKNQGEALIHATERQLAEHGEKISEADKSAIESASAALRASLATENVGDIASKTQALVQASMKIGEAIYSGAQGGGPADGQPGGQAQSDEGVVDAEFEEVDGQNKKSA